MNKVLMALVFVAALVALAVIFLGGVSSYDLQGLALVPMKLLALVLWIYFYSRVMPLLGDDDVNEDWERINSGNLAVALYRALEYAVIVIAGAMLIYKV